MIPDKKIVILHFKSEIFQWHRAAVSCSPNGAWVGGVKFWFGTTGKLGRAWHQCMVFLAGSAGPCMVWIVYSNPHTTLTNITNMPCTMYQAQPSWPSQKCHAPMPCTAQLARQPKPKFNPTNSSPIWTTWYCCYSFSIRKICDSTAWWISCLNLPWRVEIHQSVLSFFFLF